MRFELFKSLFLYKVYQIFYCILKVYIKQLGFNTKIF